MISTQLVQRAASLWYPVMLAEEADRISVSKAAELLGMTIDQYAMRKQAAIEVIETLVKSLPSPLTSLLDVMTEKPELLTPKG